MILSSPSRFLVAGLTMSAQFLLVQPTFAVERAGRAGEGAERQIARCIHEAAGGKAWLEKTLWGLRDQEAGWIGAEIRNTNGSHDLGPLQINSWWIPKIAKLISKPSAHVRHWLRFDPCFNAGAARWIFLSGLASTGDYWTAVGVYHSPTGWRQRRYSASVARKLIKRFGSEIFAGSLTTEVYPTRNDRRRGERSWE